jgi:hypothetical protein
MTFAASSRGVRAPRITFSNLSVELMSFLRAKTSPDQNNILKRYVTVHASNLKNPSPIIVVVLVV